MLSTSRFLLSLLVAGVAVSAAGGESPKTERNPAQVDSLSLSVEESFPLQVKATLGGVLPDACSRLESVEERFEPEERTYHLEVTVARDFGAMCAQVISPFELTVPIVKAGLVTGRLEVEAHGKSAAFEIEPLGEFPGLDLPSGGTSRWMCVVEPRLCFASPREWVRDGLTWTSPSDLSSRLGLRWWPGGDEDPEGHLPTGTELHERSVARLGWVIGTWMKASREEGTRWSEHIFARCGQAGWCEFWVESPTEYLLDAAGESFWRLVRFSTRF